MKRVLIANRGEIAIRIARACMEAGLESVAVYSGDDSESLHVRKADAAVPLSGTGVAAYIDHDAVLMAARSAGCDAIHPGYGFLSENADFARKCSDAGLIFIGPAAETIALFGDKSSARELAQQCGVNVVPGTSRDVSLTEAQAFMEELNGAPAIIKAVAGGGGRGMRIVASSEELPAAFERCASEAAAAFGESALYMERYLPRVRHLEIQVVAGADGNVTHLGERECSLQRRHQKVVEFAPAPSLDSSMRQELVDAAVTLAEAARYRGVGTVEFLVECDAEGLATGRWFFIEVNPRLQVEHTVTEEVTGVDIVRTQLRIAAGATLADLGLADGPPAPRGHAIQLRINMERVNPDGSIMPSGGRLTAFDPPSGAGVRVETLGYQGYETSSRYDGLLAKLVVRSDGSFAETTRRAYRALCEFRIEGVDTNIRMLKNLLCRPEFSDNRFDTQFLELHAAELAAGSIVHPTLHASGSSAVEEVAGETEISIPGAGPVRTPLQGNLVSLHATEGDLVRAGQKIAVVEAMKMETVVLAETSGRVVSIARRPGDAMRMGETILFIEAMNEGEVEDLGDSHIEPDPAEAMTALVELVQEQHAKLLDESRPATVAKARKRGSGTARERIAQLCDAGSFMEFGGLARMHHLGDAAPADGVVTGTARIGGRPVAIVSQDFSVFGGSVGHLGSTKMDRAIELALAHGMPLVMLLDGGGHRIHDGQNSREYAAAGPVFQNLARLSGYVPIVAAVLGAGFAANTNYSGFADFVVMVRDRATMGLAGPALVKAGTGEIISAQELGGADAQVERHGLADLAVDTEQEALAALMRFLDYLPGNAGIAPPATAADPADDDAARAERLLSAVPVNTRQTYDVRDVIEPIADDGSTFEFKPGFARNIVTAFARLGGKPVGFIANQALHRGGMLDGPACEKAARFIAICDAFGLPLVFLIDVPGFFIGSEAEKSVLGRRSAKLLSELGHSTVPRVSIVLRKGYGLGYLAMAGGRSFEADAALAWPTAEICAMSVEGSVDVAFKQDYNAAPDPQKRRQELIDEMRARIGPVQAAEGFGIDDLIDPRMSRTRLLEVFGRTPARQMKRMPPKFRSIPPI